MCDFVCNFFQKRIGIMSAVVEASSCPMNQFHDSINRGSICMHVYLGPSLLASQTESPSCYHLTCTRSVLWCAQEVELTKEWHASSLRSSAGVLIEILLCGAQMGYNLLYGLWKYAWDADCELFLRIMQGEMKEDVYYQQIQLQVSAACFWDDKLCHKQLACSLQWDAVSSQSCEAHWGSTYASLSLICTQEDLENLLSTLDKSMHGAETGSLTKAEVCSALESFFAVGQPGGKTVNRFDELLQVRYAHAWLASPIIVIDGSWSQCHMLPSGNLGSVCTT